MNLNANTIGEEEFIKLFGLSPSLLGGIKRFLFNLIYLG
jgi:hypothetical protein